jgi:hypothetical protein
MAWRWAATGGGRRPTVDGMAAAGDSERGRRRAQTAADGMRHARTGRRQRERGKAQASGEEEEGAERWPAAAARGGAGGAAAARAGQGLRERGEAAEPIGIG